MFYFTCLTVLTRTSDAMWNKGSEGRDPKILPNLRGKQWPMGIHDDKKISSISRDFFPTVFMFSWKLIEFCSVCFLYLLKWYFSFPFYSITVIFDIYWLSLHKLNNLTVLGSSHLITEYYLYYCVVKIILLVFYWGYFAKILMEYIDQ